MRAPCCRERGSRIVAELMDGHRQNSCATGSRKVPTHTSTMLSEHQNAATKHVAAQTPSIQHDKVTYGRARCTSASGDFIIRQGAARAASQQHRPEHPRYRPSNVTKTACVQGMLSIGIAFLFGKQRVASEHLYCIPKPEKKHKGAEAGCGADTE